MEDKLIELIENSIKKNWDRKAFTDFNGESLQYKDVARKIAKMHLLFEAADIRPGDKIALCGRNSGNWCVAFLATITYGAVIVPILHEFKQTTADKYGIESLALVGSAARGEQRENSDIDVCVKLRKTTFRAYMAIKEELEHLFHTKVDLITLHENMRQMFRHNLEQDAIYV